MVCVVMCVWCGWCFCVVVWFCLWFGVVCVVEGVFGMCVVNI